MRLDFDTTEVAGVASRVERLQVATLREEITRIVVANSERRINTTKVAPSGNPWPARSPEYEATAPGELMEATGDLLRSIVGFDEGEDIIVGSPLLYAGVLQDGTRRTPARPFLGLGEDDESAISELIGSWFAESLR